MQAHTCNICISTTFRGSCSITHFLPLFPPLHLFLAYNYLLLLTWKSPFCDRGANVHPQSSPVGDRLSHPLLSTLLLPSQRLPQFMLHVFKDDITTSVTLSDTLIMFSDSTTTFFLICVIILLDNIIDRVIYLNDDNFLIFVII
jgi:hypothetical protein